ncbi:MAG: DNA cytosine methyltransferase [Deferribacterales bacterium]
MGRLRAIDLFAGAGGLTVGLKQAGINVIEAIEIDIDASETYKYNHPEVKVNTTDITKIPDEYFIQLKNKGINIVTGCPPCQGFSSLTMKKDDPRNKLVYEFLRAIKIIEPQAVMMENVPGMAKRGKEIFDDVLNQLAQMGYYTSYKVLQVADFGVPQSRNRLVMYASKAKKIEMPSTTHAEKGENGKLKWLTVKDAFENITIPTPLTIRQVSENAIENMNHWSIIRELAPINKERLKYIKSGSNRYSIPDELRPPCHKGKNKGYGNVYARMDWDKPSPTITTGCTTMSTGRFIHPEEDRTISVREAAILQTFPIGYTFKTRYLERACRLVGNALPCKFAEALSKHLVNELNSSTA